MYIAVWQYGSMAVWQYGSMAVKQYGSIYISRSEQAPGSVFHPRDESGKIDCDFPQPFWCNIKVDTER